MRNIKEEISRAIFLSASGEFDHIPLVDSDPLDVSTYVCPKGLSKSLFYFAGETTDTFSWNSEDHRHLGYWAFLNGTSDRIDFYGSKEKFKKPNIVKRFLARLIFDATWNDSL